MNRSNTGTRGVDVVLFVGGDDAAARDCARAASPLPVLRAKQVATASDRLRAMRPRALVLAPDVPEAEAAALTKLASEQDSPVVPVVRLAPGLAVGELLLRL